MKTVIFLFITIFSYVKTIAFIITFYFFLINRILLKPFFGSTASVQQILLHQYNKFCCTSTTNFTSLYLEFY